LNLQKGNERVVSKRERGETLCMFGTKEKHRKFEGQDFSRKKFGGAVWNQGIGILNLCEMGYLIEILDEK
jgi:hypothetical protein